MEMASRVSGKPTDLGGSSAAALSLATAASSLAATPAMHADPVDTAAVVLKVIDGDAVDIRDDIRGRVRIRLLGIDTPETKKPGYTVGCWALRHRNSRRKHFLGNASRSLSSPPKI